MRGSDAGSSAIGRSWRPRTPPLALISPIAISAHWFIDFSTMAVVPVSEYMTPTGISSAAQALRVRMAGAASAVAASPETFSKVLLSRRVIVPPFAHAVVRFVIVTFLFASFLRGISEYQAKAIRPARRNTIEVRARSIQLSTISLLSPHPDSPPPRGANPVGRPRKTKKSPPLRRGACGLRCLWLPTTLSESRARGIRLAST